MSGVEYATRIPSTSIVTGNTVTFTFNATGLAYLNSVKNKANLPGYALFGIVWGGQVDNITPAWQKVCKLMLETHGKM